MDEPNGHLAAPSVDGIVFSLNVPIPGEVHRLIASLRPGLHVLDSVRESRTLVVKRLGSDEDTFDRIATEVRQVLAGTPPFDASVTRIDTFERPVSGAAPVVYLAVDSPGLERIHARLGHKLGVVNGLEGEEYVPHITLGRGGSPDSVDRLTRRHFQPVTWTVTRLDFWDRRRNKLVGSQRLRE